MPKRRSIRGIDADTLRALQQNGADSAVLRARLLWADADTFRKALEPLAELPRCHPSMMPTQSSGRWSTSDPPVVNFPTDERAKDKGLPPLQNIFVPDLHRYWISFDLDAIEGKMLAVLSGDEADIEAFNNDWDVHMLTACQAFKLSIPTEKTNKIHDCPCTDCVGWRTYYEWKGKDDLRRHMVKTGRYGLGYGGDPRDPYNLRRMAMAILNARGVEKLRMRREQLLEFAVTYLKAKPKLVEWKARTWAECIRTRQSRTHRGRRRMLFGTPESMAREGLNHEVQGGVADEMNLSIKWVVHPREGVYGRHSWLVLNKHDGAGFSMPETIDPEEALNTIRPFVEREWEVKGHKIRVTAAWWITQPDGQKLKVKDADGALRVVRRIA